MKQEETKFKERVLSRLKAIQGAWVFKTQEVARSGIPDILVCLHGVFIALELKTLSGKISALQEYNLAKIQKCGGIAIIVTPKNFKDVVEFLEVCETMTNEELHEQYYRLTKETTNGN